MKYLKVILAILGLHSGITVIAKNADVTCIYRETVRRDVTQPAHTQQVTYKNATDIDCCTEADIVCQKRLQESAQEFCDRQDRVPSGYTFSSARVLCGKGFVGQEEGIDYPAD